MELNPISKHLYEFIQSYPNKYHFKFTSSNKRIVTQLLSALTQATVDWKTIDYQTMPYNVDLNTDIFSSVPSKIKQDIIKWRTKTCHSYRFSISGRTIYVHICMPHANVDNSFFIDSLKLIYLWLSIAVKYATAECSQEMNIYLFLSDFTKKKNDSGEPMHPFHANTAYTNLCYPTTNMVVFRQEEWFKVLIHETFHNLGLDFSLMDNTYVKQTLAKQFYIDSKFELFETYNETWAEIMNVMFLGFLTQRPSAEKIINEIENLMNLEIRFSLFQCVKVLRHHHLKYSDILLQHSSNSYREHTNIFCYYVLKSLMLFFTDEFMEWCQKHNENLLNFEKTPENLENFCQFVLQLSQKPEYLQEINIMESWSKKQHNSVAQESMRMTIFG
jgi:hypothetical protein